VHPRVATGSDQTRRYSWTRRARGQYRWDDGVDVPLVEEREAYLVGFGPVDAPHAAWERDAAWLELTAADHAGLLALHGPGPLWVRQVGTFDQSSALLLAHLS
jgi:hypothetical protein